MSKKYVSVYDRANKSRRNSVVVVAVFILLFMLLFSVIGYFASGVAHYYISWQEMLISVLGGAAVGLLISLLISIYTYRKSGKILAKAANAKEIRREESPYLYETVKSIAAGAMINPPKVYIINSEEMNAFASGTGKGKSMIAVTQGLLNKLNREELEGVIAHEISHLKNDDIKWVSLAAALSATLLMLMHMLGRGWLFSGRGIRGGSRNQKQGGNPLVAIILMAVALIAIILGPLIARAMQSAVSKQREYLADASGAAIIGYPLGLASALEKIDKHNRAYMENYKTVIDNVSVHALCISPPVIKKAAGLFSTHPPIEERIRRLRGMGRENI
jgi:heat shock protein HtpX